MNKFVPMALLLLMVGVAQPLQAFSEEQKEAQKDFKVEAPKAPAVAAPSLTEKSPDEMLQKSDSFMPKPDDVKGLSTGQSQPVAPQDLLKPQSPVKEVVPAK